MTSERLLATLFVGHSSLGDAPKAGLARLSESHTPRRVWTAAAAGEGETSLPVVAAAAGSSGRWAEPAIAPSTRASSSFAAAGGESAGRARVAGSAVATSAAAAVSRRIHPRRSPSRQCWPAILYGRLLDAL